jgi:hypothetical protein
MMVMRKKETPFFPGLTDREAGMNFLCFCFGFAQMNARTGKPGAEAQRVGRARFRAA